LNAPLLTWSSDATLEIAFDFEGAAISVNEFKLRGWGASGRIHVVPRQYTGPNKS
jgi:hypothetical protein